MSSLSGVRGGIPAKNGFHCFPSVTECLSLRCFKHATVFAEFSGGPSKYATDTNSEQLSPFIVSMVVKRKV